MSTSVLKSTEFKNIISNIRFYDRKYPDKNEFVYAKITRYEETGIFCYLYEYKCEALLSFKDASSSKKLKNIKKQVKKGGSYILTVIDVDKEKHFIDVEKRSIDEAEQASFEQLILFYEKIFNVFVKAFYIKNPNSSTEDIYNFLRKTLWLQDPKLIQKNISCIHTEPRRISELYNIDILPENDILAQISKHIKKPSYKHMIKLEVKTISLDGIKHIANTLDKLSKKLFLPEFLVYGAPYYYCIVKTEYDPSFNPDEYLEKIKSDIKCFISENKTDNLGIKIEEAYYKLV